jgi:hypothetical protein
LVTKEANLDMACDGPNLALALLLESVTYIQKRGWMKGWEWLICNIFHMCEILLRQI